MLGKNKRRNIAGEKFYDGYAYLERKEFLWRKKKKKFLILKIIGKTKMWEDLKNRTHLEKLVGRENNKYDKVKTIWKLFRE